MVNDTLDDVISKVASIVNQETTVDDTSDEYDLWRAYINIAQLEWARSYDWPHLYSEYNTRTSAPVGTANAATITLPAGFSKLAGYPKVVADGTNTDEYQEIDPYTRSQYLDTDKYCYLLHASTVAYLVVNPGTLVSGASIYIPYWRSPASLVSPLNMIDCPDSQYLVQRAVAMIWESREDARFPQAKADAEKILARLIEYEGARGPQFKGKIQTQEEKTYDFRIGKD